MRTIITILGRSATAMLSFILLSHCTAAQNPAVSSAPAALQKKEADSSAPPPAPGYKTSTEVLAAIGAQQVKLISQPTSIPEGVVELTNIEYGKVNDRSLQLDLYLPEHIAKPVPGLIFIHGGAWSGGNRQVYKYYTVRFAKRGYAAATISYRLSGEAPFPAAVEDAKCAVRWMRANADKYKIDPNKIAVIGGSAGGHLSMMVGYSADVPELEGAGGNAGTSSRAQAVVNLYGPTDLTTDIAKNSGAVKKFLSDKTFQEAPELYRKASPITYLDMSDPPTLILHGTIDDVVPIDQADKLAERLKELGVSVVYDRLEGWPHAMDVAEIVNERCQFFMNRFFEQHLGLPTDLSK